MATASDRMFDRAATNSSEAATTWNGAGDLWDKFNKLKKFLTWNTCQRLQAVTNLKLDRSSVLVIPPLQLFSEADAAVAADHC